MTPFETDVATVLAALRDGEVVSYGEVAAEAGHPGAHRAVGRFLRDYGGHHWWRVVTSTGRLVPGHEVEQARLLGCRRTLLTLQRIDVLIFTTDVVTLGDYFCRFQHWHVGGRIQLDYGL